MMTADSEELPDEPERGAANLLDEGALLQPLELAAPVSSRVRIDSVSLYDCVILRESGVDLASESLVIATGVRDIEWTKEVGNCITVLLSLRLDAHLMSTAREAIESTSECGAAEGMPSPQNAEESPGHVVLSIHASFTVTYMLEDTSGLEAANIEAFAKLNGVYNGWPYWRELVQNLTCRMGIPPITVPVYRV